MDKLLAATLPPSSTSPPQSQPDAKCRRRSLLPKGSGGTQPAAAAALRDCATALEKTEGPRIQALEEKVDKLLAATLPPSQLRAQADASAEQARASIQLSKQLAMLEDKLKHKQGVVDRAKARLAELAKQHDILAVQVAAEEAHLVETRAAIDDLELQLEVAREKKVGLNSRTTGWAVHLDTFGCTRSSTGPTARMA